jgi:(R,R)-butanediol dehydrogenase/meso-butanediol dehydrogenase/diacetyl reductase
VFDPIAEDVPAQIRERTTVGVDVAIECAGNENSLASCLRGVRGQGVVVQVRLPTAACKPRPAALGDERHNASRKFLLPDLFVAARDRINWRC